MTTIDGVRHQLGPDQNAALRKFHEIKSRRPAEVSTGSIDAILDKFLTYCKEDKKPTTWRWYRDYLQDFLDYLRSRNVNSTTFPVNDLKVKTVRGWVDERGKAKRGRITAIKSAYSWADEER